MNRRGFLFSSIAVSMIFSATAVRPGAGSVGRLEYGAKRLRDWAFQSRLSNAFPAILCDPHFVIAANGHVMGTDLESLVRQSLGISLAVFEGLPAQAIRDAHLDSKNGDLLAQRYRVLDGYVITDAEIALRKIFDRVAGR